MIDYLKGQTKRGVAQFAKEYYGVDLDSTMTKRNMIEMFEDFDDPIKELPEDFDETDSESISNESDKTTGESIKDADDSLQSVLEDMADEVICVETKFEPKWSPSYRRGDEYYQPIASNVLHDWHIGRRDSDELRTIEFWIERNGKLLVHDKSSDCFAYLR